MLKVYAVPGLGSLDYVIVPGVRRRCCDEARMPRPRDRVKTSETWRSVKVPGIGHKRHVRKVGNLDDSGNDPKRGEVTEKVVVGTYSDSCKEVPVWFTKEKLVSCGTLVSP